MKPLFNAFGFPVSIDENTGEVLHVGEIYNGEGYLLEFAEGSRVPLIDEEGNYLVDVNAERAPFWTAVETNYPPDFDVTNPELPSWLRLNLPSRYPPSFFTSVLDAKCITTSDISTGIKPGVVSGYSYTDSNGNSRHKYEVLKTLSSSFLKSVTEEDPDVPDEETDPSEL